MRDTNFTKGNQEMTRDIEYVTMPQNDKRQIEQIAREYGSEPAKGLAHGIQKDAIQNGVGARLPGNERNSYRNWKFSFELLKIDSEYALSFWDEGTTGLTGEILNVNEIERWSEEGKLTEDQNLSRFLIRFESGGNIGPGSFGRGKLIFQAASKASSILCDSLRYNDKKYVAFDRKIMGTQLKQMRIPYQDEEAKRFIEEISGGALHPLTTPGTRITILDLKDELVEAVKKSFDESSGDNYSESFVKMIEETWWEILDKFVDAKVFVKWDDKTRQVELSEPVRLIAKAIDNKRGWRVYKKLLLDVVVGNEIYKIKELKFALSPKPIDEYLHDFWVQRKRMKVGSIYRGIIPHHTIQKRLCGYVILDPRLEDLILESEGITHYSFNLGGRGIRQIRQIIRSHLEAFQKNLGLRTESYQSRTRQDMLDVLEELNKSASDLGLITESSTGIKKKWVEIIILEFNLPNENSKRVEINQLVGPITFEIKNKSTKSLSLEFLLTAEQSENEKTEKLLNKEKINLKSKETKTIEVEAFQFNAEDFRYGEGILISAKIIDRKSNKKMCQVSRMVWFGIEEPTSPEDPFTVVAYPPLFPRAKSSRVELGESIRDLRFKISNTTAYDVKINVDLVARKAKSPSADVKVLKKLITEKGTLLPAMSEREFAYEALDISRETFGWINDGLLDPKERKCEIFFSARVAENIPELNMIKGKKIGKKKIEFFIGIDPAGSSIFKTVENWDAPEEGKRSRYDGDRASGYTFLLNVGHPAYKLADSYGDDVRQDYIREQMLHQAFAIAITEEEFCGVAEEFSEELDRGDISPSEAFLIIEEIIGKALIKLG